MMRASTSLLAATAVLAQCGSAAVFDLPVWYRNTYALVEMEVGTPPVKHLLRFDTGSATSWVVRKDCANGGCENYSGFPWIGYDKDNSSTAVDLNQWDQVEYLGGSMGGQVMADMWELGGRAAWNQTFIAAVTSSWMTLPADGFLGLAFNSIAEPRTQTVVETMMQEGLLDTPRFGLYYGTEFNFTGAGGKGDAPGDGVLTIGGSKEHDYVDGELTWLPGHKDQVAGGQEAYQLWRSTLRGVSGSRHATHGSHVVANGTIEYGAGQANGVFDTGAAGITVPLTSIDALYDSIGWPSYADLLKGRYIPLCTDFNSSWSVTFSFSEDGVHYSNITLDGTQLRGTGGFANRADACFPPFSDSGNGGLYLFGQQFLSQFYTVFDFGGSKVQDYKPRIGFGGLKKGFGPRCNAHRV